MNSPFAWPGGSRVGRTALYLILDCGISPMQIVNLRIGDVDFIGGLISVTKSKSRAGVRCLPMSSRIKEKLFAHIRARTEGWFFPSIRYRGPPIKRHALTSAWMRVCEKAGIPENVRFYDNRHQFASDVMKKTRNPFLLLPLMGHTDLATTSRYQHHDIAGVGDSDG